MNKKLKFYFVIVFCLFTLVIGCLGNVVNLFADEDIMQTKNDKSLNTVTVFNTLSQGEKGYKMQGNGAVYALTKKISGKATGSLNINNFPFNEVEGVFDGGIVISVSDSEQFYENCLSLTVRRSGRKTGSSFTYNLKIFDKGSDVFSCEATGALYDDIYNGVGGNSNLQFYIGRGEKLAIDVEGVPDGSLIKNNIVRINSDVLLSKEIDSNSLADKLMNNLVEELYYKIELLPSIYGDYDIDVMRLGDEHYYDYKAVTGLSVNSEDIRYTEAGIKWEVYPQIDYSEFYLQRKYNGATEVSIKFTSKNSNFYKDTKLKQNTQYTYSLSAYKNFSTPSPKLAIVYNDLTLKTGKGSIKYLIIGLAGGAVILAIVVLTYVYLPAMKKAIGRNHDKSK